MAHDQWLHFSLYFFSILEWIESISEPNLNKIRINCKQLCWLKMKRDTLRLMGSKLCQLLVVTKSKTKDICLHFDLVYVNVLLGARNACTTIQKMQLSCNRFTNSNEQNETRKIRFWQSNTCLMSYLNSKICLAMLHHPEYMCVVLGGFVFCRFVQFLYVGKNVWMNFGWIVVFKRNTKCAKMFYI